MFHAKVVTTSAAGHESLVISSANDNRPLVCIKPRGPGEPWDVTVPTDNTYGKLAQSGDSSAILSHHNQPIMKISKIRELPSLEMTATTLDDRGIASAAPDVNENWKLTVCKGADTVLICACMLGMIIFRGRRT